MGVFSAWMWDTGRQDLVENCGSWSGVDEVWGKNKNKIANAEDILLTTMGYTQLQLDFLKPKQSSIQVPTNQVPDRKRYRQTPKTTKPFL